MRILFVLSLLACDGAGGIDAGREDVPLPLRDCTDDPLRTGLVAVQTGVEVDSFDCEILDSSDAHAEPDPMIFKAMIYVESRFDHLAVACTNNPCGTPEGWSSDETGCFGLMQVVLACGGEIVAPAILPDGHPNLERSPEGATWASSIFNPAVNIDIGIAAVAEHRARLEGEYPGCSEEQYTLMSVGSFNSYGSARGCT